MVAQAAQRKKKALWICSAVDLSHAMFDCTKCGEREQKKKGCYGGGKVAWFAETPYEGNTCPRRIAMQEPLVPLAHKLYRHTGGKLGAEVFERPVWISAAFDVVDSALCWKREQEAKNG